ncbi:MAG: CDP-diacylglycerol--serine O-phosphatidyltransferase [Phycisphaeraceae bacterium]|nr:CDP-diacylglycerol--serine O-phosphatidyltransferase [Phycisphaeraceae bacterium]
MLQRATRTQRSMRRRQRRAIIVRRGIAVAPTLMTLGNLLCGFAAVFVASRPTNVGFPFDWSQPTLAVVFIFTGMVFDALDGRVARMTHSVSELGEQLDSLADLVTFGVAPAFVVIELVDIGTPFFGRADYVFDRFVLVVAGLYVACAALRLARFNIQTPEDDNPAHQYFRGMPSPAAAGTVASLALMHQYVLAKYDADNWLVRSAAVTMVLIALLMAVAMVSKLRYVHVLNRYLRRRVTLPSFVLVVAAAGMLLLRPQLSLAGLMAAYALSAPVAATWRWWKRKREKQMPNTQ